jgi:transposase
MTPEREAMQAAIVADLRTGLTYLVIAAKHQVGYGLVVKYAKKYQLTRRRGRRKKLEAQG